MALKIRYFTFRPSVKNSSSCKLLLVFKCSCAASERVNNMNKKAIKYINYFPSITCRSNTVFVQLSN